MKARKIVNGTETGPQLFMTDRQTLKYYDNCNADIVSLYQSVESGISDVFSEAFDGFKKVLDVGCGAGRDLVLLLKLGHDAIGADASQSMLDAASQACRKAGYDHGDRLILDSLPELKSFPDSSFDGILCSAVLMHLPEQHHFDAVYGMRRLLRPGGRLLLSIPACRPNIDPATRRDSHGRYFADLPPAKARLLLERIGFRLLWEKEMADALQRQDVTWATFLFERESSDSERPLDQVESILNRDKKDATYKLALFRALADIAQTQYNVAGYDLSGRVGIPIRVLAERWFVYYWPLVASNTFIAQKHGESLECGKPIAIRAPLRNVIEAFGEGGGLPAFQVALKNGQLDDSALRVYRDAMKKIESTIWNMPVRYAGGGADFSVLDYDKGTRRVTMPAELWRELTLTGSWILDATVLRWAELTKTLSKGNVTVSLAVEKLLSISDPERETRDARLLFERIGVLNCVWSDKPIRAGRFDVDHVIPFVLWRNNDLWNLLPTHPTVNNAKRDMLPSQPLLRRRRDAVIGYWESLREAYMERFDREASSLCGCSHLPRTDWQLSLFARMAEAVEITAVQRCVPRWPVPPATSLVSTPFRQQSRRISAASHSPARRRHDPRPMRKPSRAAATEICDIADIQDQVFKRYLPLVGALAAGVPFSGFDIADIQAASECPWIKVPERLAGHNRFVVRITGDSMEPELAVGDHVIFEYHRSPRAPNQIVIANIAELGVNSDLITEHAVKRLIQTPDHWVFRSANPLYDDIAIAKTECAYPILGIMIERLE